MKQQIDTSMAEKWLDPDTFVYKGKTYRTDGFTIKRVKVPTKKEVKE